MQHIFAFNDETRRYDESGKLHSPDAEEALQHGMFYYKIDGSNGMVQVIRPAADDDEPIRFKAFQRLDTRGKEPPTESINNEPPLIPLPPGKNPTTYAGHSYYYSEISNNVAGKKLVKRNRAMLDLVTRHADHLVAMDREWISVEWVGAMFNKTPSVPHAIALAIHDDQRLVVGGGEMEGVLQLPPTTTQPTPTPTPTTTITRSFDGMRKFLMDDCADHPIEGLVLEHEGVYWKIRSDGFLLPKGVKDPFKGQNRENAMAPIFLV